MLKSRERERVNSARNFLPSTIFKAIKPALFLFCAGFLFFGLAGEAQGATYYVSTSGLDTYTSVQAQNPATPWRHHPREVNATSNSVATTLSAGDTVVFRRGDIFYDVYINNTNSGTNGNPVTATSSNAFYAVSSSDSLPVLSAAYDPSTLTWAQDAANADYYVSGTNPIASNPNLLSWNGTVLPSVASQALVRSTSNSWWYDSTNKTVYLNVGASPSTGTPEIAKEGWVVQANGDYQTYSNLILQNPRTTAAGVINSNTSRIGIVADTLTVRQFQKHGIYYDTSGSGGEIKNCTVYSSKTVGDSDRAGIYVIGSTDTKIHNNTLYNLTANGIQTPTGTRVLTYSNTIHDTTNYGIQISGTSNEVYLNTIYNIWNGVYYGGGTVTGFGVILTGTSATNKIYRNNIYDNDEAIRLVPTGGNGGDQIYNNILLRSFLNNIDYGNDNGVDYQLIYNNTIYHSPSVNNTPAYKGHGIAIQTTAKKAKISNNNIIIAPGGAVSDSQGIFIGGTYSSIWLDYNNYFIPTSGNGSIGELNAGANRTSISTWRSDVQGDAAIFDMNGNAGQAEAHSNLSDSQFVNLSSDYHLLSGSPAIDAGTDVGLTTDYAGNPIYGVPDIGGYEYQPPYTFASVPIPTTGSVRLYTDGQYRMTTASSTADTGAFSVTPAGGYNSATTTQFMDITIDSWLTTGTKNKQWTATSTDGGVGYTQATSTIYTIGDLSPNTYYQFKLDGTASSTAITGYGSTTCSQYGSCLSDSNGQVQFTYNGGYSTHTFALTQDVTSPSAFTLTSPASGSDTGGTQSFSWNASSDSESGLSKYQLYIGDTLNKDNIPSSSTSVTSTNVSCGSSWHIRAIDNNGNYTDSNTFGLGMPCGSGGGGSGSSSSIASASESSSQTTMASTQTSTATTPTAVPTPTLESIQSKIADIIVEVSNLPKNPSVPDLNSIQTKLLNIISELQSIQPSQSSPSSKAIFTTGLYYGLQSDDVKNLQTILKQDKDIYPESMVTGYFGSATLRAVKRFQIKYGIAHEGDQGYGYVGPKTRERLRGM